MSAYLVGLERWLAAAGASVLFSELIERRRLVVPSSTERPRYEREEADDITQVHYTAYEYGEHSFGAQYSFYGEHKT